MLTRLREKARSIVNDIARVAHRMGLRPNSITVMGFFLALSSAISYGFRISTLLATTLLLLSGFLDVLDGTIASLYDEATAFGGFLDSILDRCSDSLVIIGIIVGRYCDTTWGLIVLAGTLLVSYTRAKAESIGVGLESIGLAERAERITVICVASLLTFLIEDALGFGIVLLAFLTYLTVLQRIYHVWKKCAVSIK